MVNKLREKIATFHFRLNSDPFKVIFANPQSIIPVKFQFDSKNK